MALAEAARDVLDFWFLSESDPAHGASRTVWFGKDPVFDAEVVDRHAASIERALRGEHDDWADQPKGALALVLVLDQFTRNAFRDTARAFASDRQALAVAGALVGRRFDESLPAFMRVFAYMPFEHAESLSMQGEAVRLSMRLVAESPSQAAMLDSARRHRAVIERFGRFPHRNAILGRQSTAEELLFLTQPGSRF